MCKTKAKGGKRCPVHTSTAFAVTQLTLASLSSDDKIYMDISHVNDTFKMLRQESLGADYRHGDINDWQEFIENVKQSVDNLEVHGRTKTAIKKHCDDALDEVIDAPSFCALTNIHHLMAMQKNLVVGYLEDVAKVSDADEKEVLECYNNAKKEVTNNPKAYEESFTDNNIAFAVLNGFPNDPCSIYALEAVNKKFIAPHVIDGQFRCPRCGQFADSSHSCSTGKEHSFDYMEAHLQHTNTIHQGKDGTDVDDDLRSVLYDAKETRELLEKFDSEDVYIPPVLNLKETREYTDEEVLADLKLRSKPEYMRENATDGLATEANGLAFGIELEYDINELEHDKEEVNYLIGEALMEAGITSSQEQQGYHSARVSGWKEWSFEADSTVAGEIVSPLLYDTPETWSQLETICRIIKENGGTASIKTGSHVHVSSQHLEDSPAKHVELVARVGEYEDLIYRIGTDPNSEGKEHRPIYWCQPNEGVRSAYRKAYDSENPVLATMKPTSKWHDYHLNKEIIKKNAGHRLGLNIEGSGEGKKSHVEFRQWDGTLDPAVIQAQIKMSVAMVAHASKVDSHEEDESKPSLYPIKPVGYSNETRKGTLAHSRPLQEFCSQYFTRREDQKQLARVFAATKWQSNLSNVDPDSLSATDLDPLSSDFNSPLDDEFYYSDDTSDGDDWAERELAYFDNDSEDNW